MVVEQAHADVILLVARVLFGGVLAFNGLNHFINLEDMSGYAGAKGVPAPTIAVAGTGLLLVGGGLGILAGVFPTIAAAALAVFFVVTTPVMHDFWAVPDEQTQQEMTHFLKNVALLGASLAFLALTVQDEWAYAANVWL